MGSIHRLEPKGSVSIFELARLSPADMELAEMMIPPYSPLVGQTLEELNFREIYHLNVLAILRSDKASAHKLFDTPLIVGDRLLVEGMPQQLIALRGGNTMVVLSDLGVSSEDLIMAPIAFDLALAMGINPTPFAIALLLAVATAFLTPVTEVINIMMRKPGGYQFRHYLALNVPVLVIVLIAAIWLTPIIWPF